MGGKEESEMRGLSVFFIASILPSLIKGVGDIYGDFDEEGRWVKKGPLSLEDARPYDVDQPLFRAKSEAQPCPRDGLAGCAFVDHVHTTYGGEHTGRATIMLSYTWGYTFGAIGSALMAFCAKHGLDPRTTHVWICCMCINQHRVAGTTVTPEELKHEFESRVRGIGHIVSMLFPWDAPINLTRIWCVFELWIAVTMEGCKLDLIMPPSEGERFNETLVADFASIAKTLANVQVRTAQASRQSDLDAILAWIGDAHADVDEAVIAALREWLAVTAQAALDAMAEEERATSTLINNLGRLYEDQGEYSLAEALYTEALAGCRSKLGDDHPDTLTSMNNLGGIYDEQGKSTEAEELYIKVLAALRRQLGDDHPDTLTSMGNLGSLYYKQGKSAEAEELLTEALAGCRSKLGDDHPSTLILMSNLGVLYDEHGKYTEAEELYIKALAAYRRQLGDDHPSTLTSMGNLGSLYYKQGKSAEAEELYIKALAAKRKQLGDDHPSTLTSMGNLGSLYLEQGKYPEAEELYIKALAACRRQLGDDHPSTLTSMNKLGYLYMQQRKYPLAEALLCEELAAYRRQLGDDHENTLNTEGNLGVVRIRQGGAVRAEGAAAVASVLARLQAPPHSLPETHAWVVKFRAALAEP